MTALKDKKIKYLLIYLIMMELSFMGIPGYGGLGSGNSFIAIIKLLTQSLGFLLLILIMINYHSNKINLKTINIFLIYSIISFFSLVLDSYTNEFSFNGYGRLLTILYITPFLLIVSKLSIDDALKLGFISKLIPLLIIFILYFYDKSLVFRYIFLNGVLSETARLGGNIIPPNTLGGMLGIEIIISLYFYIKERRKSLALLIIILICMLLYTGSRSSVLSLILSIITPIILTKGISYKYKLYSLTSISLIFTIVSIYFLSNVSYDTVRISSNIGSLGGRTELWSIALSQFFEKSNIFNILIGFGFMLPNSYINFSSLHTNSMHNGYLQVLFGIGFLGFISYIGIWSSIYSKIKYFNKNNKKENQSFTLLSIFIYLAIFNLSELGSFVLMNSMTITFSLLFCIARIKK